MVTLALFVALGLINWFATLLLVESEFFRPVREFIGRRKENARRKLPVVFWYKVDYLVTCHMCTGTWVGMVLAWFAPALFGAGWPAFVLTGLLIKAIGHLVLVVHKLGEEYTKRARLEGSATERAIRNDIRERLLKRGLPTPHELAE